MGSGYQTCLKCEDIIMLNYTTKGAQWLRLETRYALVYKKNSVQLYTFGYRVRIEISSSEPTLCKIKIKIRKQAIHVQSHSSSVLRGRREETKYIYAFILGNWKHACTHSSSAGKNMTSECKLLNRIYILGWWNIGGTFSYVISNEAFRNSGQNWDKLWPKSRKLYWPEVIPYSLVNSQTSFSVTTEVAGNGWHFLSWSLLFLATTFHYLIVRIYWLWTEPIS